MLIKTTGKESHNPLYKYLNHKEFIEYCDANGVDANDKILEIYEKLRLLLPIYRFIVPKEYIRFICKQNINNSGYYLDNHPEWTPIEKLQHSLTAYTVPLEEYFKKTLREGHPLDYAIKYKNPFLVIPTKDNFKPWKFYKVKIYRNLYPCRKEEALADHYYAPWQIFVLNELNEMYTEHKNILTKHARKHWVARSFKKNKKISASEINNYSNIFQILSNYTMFKYIIRLYVEGKNTQSQFLTEEDYDFYIKETKKIAKKEYKKISYDKWMEFIKKLCELWEYLKDEKIKLSNEVKRFLSFTIDLVTIVENITFEKLDKNFVAKYGTSAVKLSDELYIVPTGLEKIFPSEINELKRTAHLYLPDLVKELNKILPVEEQFPENFHENMITTLISEGYGTLFSHLYKIQDTWFNYEKFAFASLMAHLRSLIVSIEDIGKKWFKGNKINGMLRKAFDKEYEKLKNKYSGNYEKGITDAKTTGDFIKKANIILKHKEFSSKDRLCNYYLVLTELSRNFFSHSNEIEEKLLRSVFGEVYKSAMFTLISLYKKHKIVSGG